ncbi:ABC transporter substrate-binding protein [Myceligenerans cantabricum]
MSRIVSSVAAGAAVALTLAACSGGEDQPEPAGGGGGLTEVTVGVIPIVDVAPIYLGQEQGFFEDQGLDLNLELAQGGAAIVPAVVSGEYEFGFSNVTSLLVGVSQGVPLKVVGPGNFTTGESGNDFGGVVVGADSDIKDAAGLEGATVAVNTLNNIGDSTIRDVVAEAGGDPSKIDFVEMGFPDMPAAVANGDVDAAWILEPFLTIAQDQGAELVSSNYAETDPELMIAAYFTSEQLVAEDPETLEAFQAGLTESLTYAQEHPDETREILDGYTEIDPEVKESMVMPRFDTEMSADSFRTLADLALEYGLVEEELDTSALLP